MKDFTDLPNFRFYFIIRDGVETYELDQAPDGWNETIIEFATSKQYVALLRSLSLPYTFIGNAAYICRREYYQYFAMAQINFRIDMRQNDLSYKTIYTGKLNFAAQETTDTQIGFIVPSVSADFSGNIDAYDGVNYAIDISDGVNAQLPALSLNETATILPSGPPDGINHGYYFPPIQVVNNVQSSVDYSVRDVAYDQFKNPVFANRQSNFFWSHYNGNVYFAGNLNFAGFSGDGDNVNLSIYNEIGTLRYTLITTLDLETTNQKTYNFVLPVVENEKLYMYISQSKDDGFAYLTITGGQFDLSYQTQSPPTMTKAISGEVLFSKLLQAMNPNLNSGPNLPVPYQTFLLNSGVLKQLYFTCADSIRSGNGSFYAPGSTIGQGVYQVLQGSVNYNGTIITAPNTFAFGTSLTFTQVGTTYAYVQKIQSIFVGNVYNPGESLEAGGTYLVGGNAGTYIVYNGRNIFVGSYFSYVLGQDTFTASDISNYVKQTAESPKIVTNMTDFFQCIKSLMFGNACMGYLNGLMLLEDLGTVYQSGAAPTADMGKVGKDWKRSGAIDMLYANFKAGYSDQQYTTQNGYQEVNSTQERSTSLMLGAKPASIGAFPNELNLISPYRADPLGYEEMRISQNDTASSRSNNDVCLLWLNLTPVTTAGYTFYNPIVKADVTDLYGVVDGYYNFMLSPMSSLLRGGRYLASIFYNMADYPITLASAVKNSGMVYVYNGIRVAEADAVLPSQLGAPYFIPMYMTGSQGVGYDILAALDSNPFAPITLEVNGVTVNAFINDFKIKVANNESQDIKVLLTPNNTLTDFIE